MCVYVYIYVHILGISLSLYIYIYMLYIGVYIYIYIHTLLIWCVVDNLLYEQYVIRLHVARTLGAGPSRGKAPAALSVDGG